MANLRKQADMQEVTARCGCGRTMTPDALRGKGAYRCGCGVRVRYEESSFSSGACVAPARDRRCGGRAASGAVVPLCRDHLDAWKAALGLISSDEADEYVDRYAAVALGEEVDRSDRLTRLAEERFTRTQAGRSALQSGMADSRTKVVYYLRFDRRIKIGTTGNLQKRLAEIPHEEILALEPGGHSLERQRHQQFADLRTIGEWFRSDPRLVAHARAVRSLHGMKWLEV